MAGISIFLEHFPPDFFPFVMARLRFSACSERICQHRKNALFIPNVSISKLMARFRSSRLSLFQSAYIFPYIEGIGRSYRLQFHIFYSSTIVEMLLF